MAIVDTIANTHYGGDRVTLAMACAELLNQESRALEAQGVEQTFRLLAVVGACAGLAGQRLAA